MKMTYEKVRESAIEYHDMVQPDSDKDKTVDAFMYGYNLGLTICRSAIELYLRETSDPSFEEVLGKVITSANLFDHE